MGAGGESVERFLFIGANMADTRFTSRPMKSVCFIANLSPSIKPQMRGMQTSKTVNR